MEAMQIIGIPLVVFGVIAGIIAHTERFWGEWEFMKRRKPTS
jgi:hypothetical protein